jgi:hypothetical protein
MAHQRASKPGRIDGWARFLVFLYYGFFFVGKYFSFLAGPLLLSLFFNRRICERIYRALTRTDPLTYMCWALLLSIMDGIWECVYGILAGYKPITAFEILVFNLCPIYIFLGMWTGLQRPTLLRTFVRFNAWFGAIYTVIYFGVLRHFNSDIVGAPGSGSFVLLGLFCFEINLGAFWLPILCASFNMIAQQIRSDWAGFLVALAIWATATRRVGRVLAMIGIVALLLLFGFVFDIRMPGVEGRSTELSARDTIGRALSVFNPTLAREYSTDAAIYAGTIQWREHWWKAIREEIFSSPKTTVFGMGYGYPLADLVPYLKGSDLRTPHSIIYFALGYSGLLGVFIFVGLQLSMFALHWRNFRRNGEIYGLVLHAAILTGSLFGNLLEAPQMAIPCYLTFGMSLGPLFDSDVESQRQNFRSVFEHLTDVTEPELEDVYNPQFQRALPLPSRRYERPQ